MTLDELKNNHPGLYNQVREEAHKEGKKEGSADEQKRINGWLQWYEADSKRVMEAIKNGESLEMSEASELMKKHNDKQLRKMAEKESPEGADPQKGAENKGKGPEGSGEEVPEWLPEEFKGAVKGQEGQPEAGSEKSGPSAAGSEDSEGGSGEGSEGSGEEAKK